MTTKQFDPVFSAALRTELEARADAAGSSATVRSPLRRPQLWISVVTAAVLVLATLGILQAAAGRQTAPASSATPTRAATATRIDGLHGMADLLTDSESPEYVAPYLVLLWSGTAASGKDRVVRFASPLAVPSVRVYITCSGDGQFQVTFGKSFWGACGPDGMQRADIPVVASATPPALRIHVSKGTSASVIMIATPATP